MGPAPVAATTGKATSTLGAPKGISATAHKVGKPGRAQNLGSIVGRRGNNMAAISGGNTSAQSMNHFGKKAPALLGGNLAASSNPTASHAGAKIVRGGNMRTHIRTGGLATQAPVGADVE